MRKVRRKRIKEAGKHPAERALAAVERRLIAAEPALSFRPIFVVAPARSGSTLLYQAMTRYFELCYFSNAMTRFPQTPVCLAHLLAPLGGCDTPATFPTPRRHVLGATAPSNA